ncbi:MAG: hypothetical protein AAGF12_08830 [Myxococcota bacterium]
MRNSFKFMRAVFTTLVVLFLSGCGEPEHAELPASANPPSSVELPPISAEVAQPRHGGTVIVAQDHAVEILPGEGGEIRGWVVGVDGEAPPPAEADILVNIHGSDDTLHPVEMSWSTETASYVGQLLEVRPAPGPASVVLTIDGRARRGRIETYRVVDAFAGSASLDVELAGRPPEPSAHFAPAARTHLEVNVRAPRPPPARVQVDVRPPEPPRPRRPRVQLNIHAPEPPRPRIDVNIRPPQPEVNVRVRHSVRVGSQGRRGGRRGHRRRGDDDDD